MMPSGIYKIVNGVNEKVYVGSAVRLDRREMDHWSTLRRGTHHNRHLQAAWRLYGESCFRFVVVEECLAELLIEREQYWIDSLLPEYNLSPTAGSPLGVKHTPESRARNAAARRGRPLPEATKQKMSQVRKGKVSSPETRAKLSDVLSVRMKDPETRAKISKSKIGKPRDPETSRRIAEKLRGRPLSEQHKAAVSASLSGRKLSEAHKKQIGDRCRGIPLSEDHRRKLSESHKGNKPTEETRRKMSESQKRIRRARLAEVAA